MVGCQLFSKIFLFQSTSPRGGRREFMVDKILLLSISIHVPARGTTCTSRSVSFDTGNFNPRPREGDDLPRGNFKTLAWEFQSTSPRGGRQKWIVAIYLLFEISIHVPARGTTSDCPSSRCVHSEFQSTSPRGGRRFSIRQSACGFPISIHVPARGTTTIQEDTMKAGEFQSTSPRGGRQISARRSIISDLISIHVPARGTTAKYRYTNFR